MLRALSPLGRLSLQLPKVSYPTHQTPSLARRLVSLHSGCLSTCPPCSASNKMQKLSNFTGQARHGWEKMTPAAFGMGRPNIDSHSPIPPSMKRSLIPAQMTPLTAAESMVNLSFNIPFSSNLTGPNADEVLHASPEAFQRWIHPEGTEEGLPTHKLPVHAYNVEQLRKMCKALSDGSGGRLEAAVTSSEPKPIAALQRRPLKGLVTNVCVSGDGDIVHKMRAKILNETPIALVRKSRL